jgi:DNA invertase Pin-like site-specific DNA recombinase
MKVCIYLRKSRADREHPEMPPEAVLKSHEDQLLAYAARTGLVVAGIKKEVVSGESLIRRPEMLRLLEEVEDGRYNAVLVKDFDRLGRGSMLEQGIIIEAFRKSGTKIITPEKTYDLENEFDEEFIDISALFARKELKMITKRLQSGRMRSVSDGNYISPHPPYGYDRYQKTLIINEKESEIVRLIFLLYVSNGYGDAKIAGYLNNHGIPGKHGLACWDKTTIRGILRNPVYAGMITWNRRDYRYREDGRRTSRLRSPEEWKIYPGKHEAIIEPALFEKARHEAESRSVPHLGRKKQLRNPLAQFLRCGNCGAAMTLRTASGRADSLRCSRQCGNTAGSKLLLVEERLITLLDDDLSDISLPFHRLETIGISRKESDRSHAEAILLQTQKCFTSEKNRLILQQEHLHDLLEQGVYEPSTYLARSAVLTERLETLELKLNELSKKTSGPCSASDVALDANTEAAMFHSSRPDFRDLHDFIRNVYDRLDAEHKNAFLRELIKSVVYVKDPGASQDAFSLDVILKY